MSASIGQSIDAVCKEKGIDREVVIEAVKEAVRAAAHAFEGLGCQVRDTSIPWHRDGIHIWNAIAIEGATMLMVAGNSMGTNWKRHYTTGLLEAWPRYTARLQALRDASLALAAQGGEHDRFPCIRCARALGKMEWVRQYPDSPWHAAAGPRAPAPSRLVALTYAGRAVQPA